MSAGINPRRLARALSRPGIDPRTWVTHAIVADVHLDPDYGLLADVTLLPTEDDVTVRVSTLYAGNGFGLYARLAVDDEVLIEFPDGTLEGGGWLVGRSWNAADKPIAVADDEAVVLVVEKDATVRLEVLGAGNILLKVADGKVQLVDAAGEKMPMGETLQSLLSDFLQAIAVHNHVSAVGPTTPPTNAATFVSLKAHPVADGAMLSDHATMAK
jgi:hypothetical protein